MTRSTRFDDLFKKHVRPGMTAAEVLHLLSCEGGLPHTDRLRDFRKLRTDERLRRIRSYLRCTVKG